MRRENEKQAVLKPQETVVQEKPLKQKMHDYARLLSEVHADISDMEFKKEISGNNVSLAVEFLSKASGALYSYAKSLK